MMKGLAVCLFLLAPLGAPALAAADDTLEQAAKAYKNLCARCHGLNMINPGNSSFDLRKFPRDQKARFYDSVSNGRGAMPAWGDVLLPGELDLLWLYVSTRGGKEPPPEEAAAPGSEDAGREAAGLVNRDALTVCLAKNGGVMSARRSRGGAGLDYELAAALAGRLGLDLRVEWFESEQDEESTPIREIYALLSYGVCDIVPGFALYETALGGLYRTRAALPRWDNRPADLGREFQVDLEPVAVSAPYARMEMGVVYRDAGFERDIEKLADLDGLRVGIEQGTLAGVLTLRQGTERMVAEAVTRNPGPDFLWRMEQGEFDAALVTIGAYDFHKKQNFVSTLVLDQYRHPIGFNLGVAVAERNRALLERIDPVIAELVADGGMAALAAKSKVTYAPPRAPVVQPKLTMRDILTMR